MKTKPRARRLWANFYSNGAVAFFSTKRSACLFKGFSKAATVPVAVIPLHDVPKLMAKANSAYVDACHAYVTVSGRMTYLLTAIGLLPKPRKGRK